MSREVPVRFVTKSLSEQRRNFTKSTRSTGERKKPVYRRLWNSTEAGLAALVDVKGDNLIAVTVDVSQNVDNGNIYVSLHHKAVVDTAGKYIENHRTKRLRPDELTAGLSVTADFIANVGDPETDPLGFYKATGIDTDIRPESD